jgi:hypothetical protein
MYNAISGQQLTACHSMCRCKYANNVYLMNVRTLGFPDVNASDDRCTDELSIDLHAGGHYGTVSTALLQQSHPHDTLKTNVFSAR